MCEDLIKTKCMIIPSKKFSGTACPDFKMNDCILKVVQSEKYLGYYITTDCSDNESIISVIKGLYARGNMLKRNFSHCTETVKLKLFQAYCSSLYCCSP